MAENPDGRESDDGFEDPLAVKIGLWADDIPAEGWPDTFNRDVVVRTLGYLPTDEVVEM